MIEQKSGDPQYDNDYRCALVVSRAIHGPRDTLYWHQHVARDWLAYVQGHGDKPQVDLTSDHA